jgi:rhomboid protease GluP
VRYNPQYSCEVVYTPSLKGLPDSTELRAKVRKYMSKTFLYRKAFATYVILALNVLVFLATATQGSGRVREIYGSVAVVVPQDFGSMDWWKLLAAHFFHISLPHLALNMIILCVLGAFVEFALGIRKYVLTYLVSGIVAMFMLNVYAAIFDKYVPSLRVVEPQITAGASACVLGVLGARAGIMLRMWANDRSRIARNHFLLMGFIVLMQAVIDVRNLTISFGAHLTGAFVGFILGLLMKHEPIDLSSADPFGLVGAVKQS